MIKSQNEGKTKYYCKDNYQKYTITVHLHRIAYLYM